MKKSFEYILFGELAGLVIGFIIWPPLAYITTPIGAFLGYRLA